MQRSLRWAIAATRVQLRNRPVAVGCQRVTGIFFDAHVLRSPPSYLVGLSAAGLALAAAYTAPQASASAGPDLETFVGSWTLEKNERFEDFLAHVRYGWATRKAALVASVQVTITSCDGGLIKDVRSTFYTTHESLLLDGIQRSDKDGKKLTRRFVDGEIVTDVIGTIVNWSEVTSLDPNDPKKMTTRYSWRNEDGSEGWCCQHFVRSS